MITSDKERELILAVIPIMENYAKRHARKAISSRDKGQTHTSHFHQQKADFASDWLKRAKAL